MRAIIQRMNLRQLRLRPSPRPQTIRNIHIPPRTIRRPHGIRLTPRSLDTLQSRQEIRLMRRLDSAAGDTRSGRGPFLYRGGRGHIRASACVCITDQSRARAGGDIGFATEDLHAVGGEELEGGTLQEWGGEGLARIACIACIGMGEDQFGADLIGPGAAEELVTVGDDRVARVEAEDLDSLVGESLWFG